MTDQEHSNPPLRLTEEEWSQRLSPQQYHVLREKGTEPPFSGDYNDWKERGIFVCAACGNPLFSTDEKYDSGTGWPSFWKPLAKDSVAYRLDKEHGASRVEVLCGRCESHLGHVFEDGPLPTGDRYCMNSIALFFKP